jgi:cysteine desulfuration protein SufE
MAIKRFEVMPIEERIVELKKVFAPFSQWEDRYKLMIDLGKELPELPAAGREEQFKVKGCQSQVWLYPEIYRPEGSSGPLYLRFFGDSDATIVKGIVAIILKIYSEASVQEILQTPPTFFDELGLRQHLSMSRANGLNAMIKQIFLYATALNMTK